MAQHAQIEKKYQKKSQIEHILLRPDTYIGSVELTEAQLWILDETEEHIIQKTINYCPGLYKIFDEILVNAADNFQRDKLMNKLKVDIDEKTLTISVWNNGKGIPVQIHQEYNIYVPELIFGHLLTGSNFDDNEKKVTGGRNGYGAKLTNIYSTSFMVETADNVTRKSFKMKWQNNMSIASQPEIKPYSGEDYTCITFSPDLSKFANLRTFDSDFISLMKKRVYDLAGVLKGKVKVILNGKQLKIKSFSEYVDMYFKQEPGKEIKKINDPKADSEDWEVIVAMNEDHFQQVSFVNSICTTRGGTHVTTIVDKLAEKLIETIKKKQKSINLKPFQIKNNLFIFINCLIENPAFDSQTKETLTTKPSNFRSKYEITEALLKSLSKTGLIETIILQAQARENAKMAKTLGGTKKVRLLGIGKLEDANWAGGRNAEECTLIVTEGDSAKSLAMAGIEVVGRDKYGVFPLKGKLLNVRDASVKSITENEEIQNVIKIIGLQLNKNYENVRGLRYGSLMIMADQDHDGSHIKGLLINFIHHFWPSLIHLNGFLKEFATPIIKATKGNDVISFFTISDFKAWAEQLGPSIKSWKVKYYKGLGTSTDKEAKEYFDRISFHQINFKYENVEDDQVIDLAFNKKKADDRKDWLKTYSPMTYVNHNVKELRYTDFINKELIHFSIADNMRSIPSICDGLKPGQRKILFACFKRNLKNEIKVAQLSGYVAEHSAYHHGEMSLAQTIIGMAQNFVGSNNIHLLQPIGQFGSRNLGGKDAASARYIYTSLCRTTRAIFNENDDHLLNYLDDDGQSVEPSWYLPIIPLSLVNGADGIGTGWSTNVPCYNPREIIDALINRMNGKPFSDLIPWYKGFQGEILSSPNGGYLINGKWEQSNENENEIIITELPIKKWTRDYKTYLEHLAGAPPDEKVEVIVNDIKEYHSNNRVKFQITLEENKLEQILRKDGVEKRFKLQSTLQTTNMVMFDKDGKIKKYSSVAEILEEFFVLRLEYYDKRKSYLLSKLQREIAILDNKKRFILAVITDEIKIRNVKKVEIVKQLIKGGFTQMKDMPKILSTKIGLKEYQPQNAEGQQEEEENADDNESNQAGVVPAKEFNYLLSMSLWSLTYEKVESLQKEYEGKQDELSKMKAYAIKDMWQSDLKNFLEILDEVEQIEEEERLKGPQGKGNKGKGKNNKNKPKATKRKKENDEDEVKPKEVAKVIVSQIIQSKIIEKGAKKNDTKIVEENKSIIENSNINSSKVAGEKKNKSNKDKTKSNVSESQNLKKAETQSPENNLIEKYLKKDSEHGSLFQRILNRQAEIVSPTSTSARQMKENNNEEEDFRPTRKVKKAIVSSDDDHDNQVQETPIIPPFIRNVEDKKKELKEEPSKPPPIPKRVKKSIKIFEDDESDNEIIEKKGKKSKKKKNSSSESSFVVSDSDDSY